MFSNALATFVSILDLMEQSLPSLQFSESSLEGGAAALDEVLQQVDLALSDKENWSTGEETKEFLPESAGKTVLAMVGREAKTHSRPARMTRDGKGLPVSHPPGRSTATKSKVQVKKPRNYNIKD